jgi:hypothetical protein
MIEGSHGLVRQKAIYAPVVRLRQISTGYKFSVINVHLMVAAVNGGRARPGKPRTYRVYTRQVKTLKLTVRSEKSRGLPVYVTGDFNIGYVADRKNRVRQLPYHRLTRANMVANWKGKKLNNYGTHIDDRCAHHRAHCGAYIDQIWAPKPSATSTVYTSVVHSDHYPIMSTYSVPSSANYRPTVGTVGFATTDLSAPEWNKPWQARQNPMVFPLQGDLSHGFVDVQVTDGTGVQGKDYTVDTSTLYDNDTTNDQVVVTSIPNTTPEPDKTFTLTLVDPFDTTITQATATGTLTNDD